MTINGTNHSLLRVRPIWALGAALLLNNVVACKNVVRQPGEPAAGPTHALDYSYVKFAAYNGDRVLSAGEYKGLTTRAAVIDQANQDLRKNGNCGAGNTTVFCTQNAQISSSNAGDSAPAQWIQLFLPDGSSCSVGPAPENAGIPLCFDGS
jgi:hypothetical protein